MEVFMSSPLNRPLRRRDSSTHYDITPPKFAQEVKKTALAVLEKTVPSAAGAAAGAVSFTVMNQGQSWITDDCTGWKMLMIWYLFSLVVMASAAKTVAHLAFHADKAD